MYIEKRNLVSCVIFTFLTCGIYAIYWAVKLGKDAVRYNDPEDSGTLEVLLMIFFPFAGYYLAEKKFFEGAEKHGFKKSDNSIAYLILCLFGVGIVSMCMMQNDLNVIADKSVMN